MKYSHHAQGKVRRVPVDGELVVVTDIIKELRVLQTPDRWDMELHLDPADPGKIPRIDEPFTPLAVAFQEVATTGHPDKLPQRPGRNDVVHTVPFDIPGAPLAEGSLDHPDGNTIQADILLQYRCGDRFDCDHVPAFPGSTDTKSTCIRSDIEDGIIFPYIVEEILVNGGYQAAVPR